MTTEAQAATNTTLAGAGVSGEAFSCWACASDHQFVGDAAYINLEIEALHRRTREMPGQTSRDGSPADELVGKERMDVGRKRIPTLVPPGCRSRPAERRGTLWRVLRGVFSKRDHVISEPAKH